MSKRQSLHSQQICWFTLILAMLISGCTHTRMMSRIELAEKLAPAGKQNKGEVVQTDGKIFRAKNICVQGDTIFWSDAGNNVLENRHIAGIREITLTDHGKGSGEGLLMGGACGFIFGFLIGFSSGDDEKSSNWDVVNFSAEEKGLMAGAVIGGVGAMVGIFAGATSGSKEKIVLKSDSLSASVKHPIAQNLAKTVSGMWPSDHAGVAVKLVIPLKHRK